MACAQNAVEGIVSGICYTWARFQAFCMTVRLNTNDIVCVVVGASVFLLEIVATTPGDDAALPVVTVALLAIAVPMLRVLFSFVQDKNRYQIYRNEAYREDVLRRLKLPGAYERAGYRRLVFQDGGQTEHYVQSEAVDAFLFEGSIGRSDPIQLVAKGTFQIPEELRPMVFSMLDRLFAKHRHQRLFNGRLLRMAEDILPENGRQRPIAVQLARYFDGQVTNEAVYQRIVKLDSIRDCFEGEVLLMDHDDALLELWNSRCANFIGASTIAVTSDGYMILSCQGMRSMANKGRYAPSGSGSVDYRDYVQMLSAKDPLSLQDVAICAAERELREECALSREINLDTVVIGYARLLERGGKPDFVCLTFMDATAEQVVDRFNKSVQLREVGLVDLMGVTMIEEDELLSAALEKEIIRLREEGGRISIQLQLCIDCLRNVESLPDGAAWIRRRRECG